MAEELSLAVVQRIKAAEQVRDKALADASLAYVAAVDKADDDFRDAPKRAEELYRQKDAEIRAEYARAIKAAEEKKLADSQRSYEDYTNAPEKAKSGRDTAKLTARDEYNTVKANIEAAFKVAVKAAQEAD